MSALSPEQVQSEFIGAHNDLKSRGLLPETGALFALPFGGLETDYPTLQEIVKNTGYRHYLYVNSHANKGRQLGFSVDRILAPENPHQFLYSLKSAVLRQLITRQ